MAGEGRRMSYAEFLARKARTTQPAGVDIDLDAVNPILHDWQARIVQWACHKGRAALFEDCGLGKTFQQLEWARLMGDTTLILAPLSVARQTVREAGKLGIDARYVRSGQAVDGPGIYVTNYEMVGHFDPTMFGAVVLDESSILKNADGKLRRSLTDLLAVVPHRLAATATPAPNDVAELCNHAEFLGRMPRNEMLAAYFVHDDVGWRIKGHAVGPMHEWMAQWAVAARRPSDVGGKDTGYVLPLLSVIPELVDVDIVPDGQLFATDLGGIGGRAAVRRETMDARIERCATLATDGQWIVWCGLNDEASKVTKLIDGAVNVEGSWTPEAKAEALEAFQDGQVRVLVTKPSIAGFGMNFQQCHQMAFLGLGDSYESYYQAIRRCYRFGQTEPVNVHVIVSQLEQQIVENVARKEHEASLTTTELIRYSELRRHDGIDSAGEHGSAVRGGRSVRRIMAAAAR